MYEKYKMDVGLEVHVELKTRAKIFCSCPTDFGSPPNTCVCPVCMGLPGAMPTLNTEAIELAIKAGLATGCKIASSTRFDRKNYFYPDLPKAYQISQYEYPLCFDGGIDIGSKTVGITRIHVEEDAGKLVHDEKRGTLADYNRCGVPLIEIVSEPDIESAEQAKAYLSELRAILLYAGVSDCKMNEGSFRCDVNLSVRKHGESELGVRTEIKNVNSFSFVGKAIEYEFKRQIEVLESGGKVVCETRRFDEATGKTLAMRPKESAADYRFFPEPDLLPFKVGEERVERIRATLGKTPAERRKEYKESYGIGETDARTITSRPQVAEFFETAARLTSYPRVAANVLLGELLTFAVGDEFDCPLTPMQLADIAQLFGDKTINSSTVKKLVKLCAESDLSASELVERYDLAQINDEALLARTLDAVLEQNPSLLSDFLGGKTAAEKAIIGKTMAATAGKANPVILGELWNRKKRELAAGNR